jgi:Zn finger protein HypA/HybF involved in hydrogenase expression
MNEAPVDVLCKHCGQTFSTFLEEMAAKNYKVMCPCCGEHTQYSPSDIMQPPAAAG